MKLTEKELNEFPIGTKIKYSDVEIIKVEQHAFATWKEIHREVTHVNPDILKTMGSIKKVEIPAYTEYIPPKPILDDKEKEWFDFVKPFRNKVKYISKVAYSEYEEFISIATGASWFVSFPPFKAGTMYKGMELDREYSLEELEL